MNNGDTPCFSERTVFEISGAPRLNWSVAVRYTKTGPILVPVGQRLRVIPFDGVNYGIYIVQNMKILSDKISPAVAG